MKINLRWSELRLASLITVGVIGIVIVTTLSLLLVVHDFAVDYARKEAEARLKQLAWQMRDGLDQSMRDRVSDIKNLARRRAVRKNVDAGTLRSALDELQGEFSDYAWIGMADPNGKVLASTHGMLEGQSVAERPWFMGGQKALFIGDYHPALLLAKSLPYAEQPWRFVDISLPIFGEDGAYKGVLGAHLSWSWARTMANNLLNPANSRYEVDILVVREDGTIMLGPPGTEENRIQSHAFDLSRKGESDAIVEQLNGTRYITGYARTGQWASQMSPNWSILIRQPEQVALNDFRILEHKVLVMGSLIGLVLLLVAVATSRRLSAPLNALSAAIESRPIGGDESDIPTVRSYYEINVLSHTLVGMVERERLHLAQARSINENLEHHVNERTQQLNQTALALQRALEEQGESQMQLEESENELRAILQNANDAFIAIDETGAILEWNRAAELLFGWRRDDALGQKLELLIIPEAMRDKHLQGIQHFLATGDGPLIDSRIEIPGLRRDGTEIALELVIGHVQRRAGHLFIAFLHDISERQALRRSLETLAFTDTLTGLLNRRAFLQKLPEAIARSTRNRKRMALLFLDVDGFKGVNDTYGHEAGDELLRLFAARIQQSVRTVDTVARFAGDEFTVILEQLVDNDGALEVATKILLAMRQPFTLSGSSVLVTSSIGITMFLPNDTTSLETLMRQADTAMYSAKHGGKDRVCFDGIQI